MLVSAVQQALVHFRKDHDNLVLLYIGDRFVKYEGLVQLERG